MTTTINHPDVTGLLPTPRGGHCWDTKDEAELVCRAVLQITHDVKTFLFAPIGEQLFHFEAGQFITLALPVDGQIVSRCYTISSPPTRPHLIAITVKRVPGGPVSNWLHDHLTPGTKVTVLAPLGQFTLTSQPAAKYLFLSAGSGITPLMSMTRTLVDLGSDADVLFVHAARTPVDIIFRRELDAVTSVTPNVRVVHVCEADYPTEQWAGLRGRITPTILQELAPDLVDRTIYCCGPIPFMDAMKGALADCNYDPNRYHEESFSFEGLPVDQRLRVEAPRPFDDPGAAGPGLDTPGKVSFSIEFVRSGRTISCDADQNILDAAFAAGLQPPSSCSQGMCGTCKTTMLSGEVDMVHSGGIRPKEVAQNKILICCSKPLGDVRVDA